VLCCDGYADDSDCEECSQEQVHDGELEPRQDDPDDVHDQCERAARRFGFTYLAAERCEHAARELEALDAERDTDDRQAQHDATEQVAEEDHKPAEDEEHEIAEQRHWRSFHTGYLNPTPACLRPGGSSRLPAVRPKTLAVTSSHQPESSCPRNRKRMYR